MPGIPFILKILIPLAIALFLIGMVFWTKMRFLPLYDSRPSAHFQVNDDSVPGTTTSCVLGFFFGAIFPFFAPCILSCCAPIKARWASWIGSGVTGLLHLLSCEIWARIVGSRPFFTWEGLSFMIACGDYTFIGYVIMAIILTGMILPSCYYYLVLRALNLPQHNEMSSVLSEAEEDSSS